MLESELLAHELLPVLYQETRDNRPLTMMLQRLEAVLTRVEQASGVSSK